MYDLLVLMKKDNASVKKILKNLSEDVNLKDEMDLVIEGEKYIKDTNGKDIIIFIGGTQIGKSTTINALLGVPFKKQNGKLIPQKELIAKIGASDNGGVSCTIFPALYCADHYTYFLDTQGFFESRNSAIAASSILMEMAIKDAKSIRIVFLGNYEEIKSGLSKLDRYNIPLSKLFLNMDIPIFFLWNKFTLGDFDEDFLQNEYLQWDYTKKHNFIMEQIDTKTKEFIKNATINLEKSKEKIERENNISLETYGQNIKYLFTGEKQNNKFENCEINQINADLLKEEIKELEKENIIIHLIKKSYESRNFGYFDPTQEESIRDFYEKIKKCEIAKKEDFTYRELSKERVNFNENFERNIYEHTKVLQKYLFAKTYSKDDLLYIKLFIDNEIKTCNEDLKNVNNINEIDKLQNKYNLKIEENIKDLYDEINEFNTQAIRIKKKLNIKRNAEPIVYFHEDIKDPASFVFGWWRNHHTHYISDIPIAKVETHLDENTYLVNENLYEDSQNYIYDARFQSKFGKGCYGKISFYAYPKDIDSDFIEQKEKELRDLLDLIASSEQYRNKLLKKIKSEIKNNINEIIKKDKALIEKVDEIKSFIEQTLEKWNIDFNATTSNNTKYCDLLKSFKHIIDKLYSASQVNSKENIKIFLNLYNKIQTATNKKVDINNIKKIINEYELIQKPTNLN